MEELPYEMVEHILSFLPLASLSAVWEVDMRMREVLRSEGSMLFKYITLENTIDLVHKHGYLGLAEFLITRPGINPNKLVAGKSILQLCTHQGRLACISLLMKHPLLEVNFADHWVQTALHKACQAGHKNIIEELLNHPDIDVNAQDNLGQTSLHIAVSDENIDVVDQLLEVKGIEINIQDTFGHSVLHVAGRAGFLDILQLILKQEDLDQNVQDSSGRSCLHLACWAGNEEAIDILVNTEAVNMNLANHLGDTLLHLASSWGLTQIVGACLKNCSTEPNLLNREKNAALSLAVWEGHLETVRVMVKFDKVDINLNRAIAEIRKNSGENTGRGMTPLHLASERGWVEIVCLLLDQEGIDIDIQNNYGETAENVAHTKQIRDLIMEKRKEMEKK